MNTLRNVINDDDKWYALLRDYYQHFKYQTIMTTDMVTFFNRHTGLQLRPIFDQYLRHAAIPMLELRFDEDVHMVSYRWLAQEKQFAMPVRVGLKNSWQIITPTTAWQRMSTNIAKDEFDVATRSLLHKCEQAIGRIMGISESRSVVAVTAMLLSGLPAQGAAAARWPTIASGYANLTKLFEQWRDFRASPPCRAMCPTTVPPPWLPNSGGLAPHGKKSSRPSIRKAGRMAQLNDYKLVRAEMNGLDFNLRVLRPWARDPAFYVSVWSARTDVPSPRRSRTSIRRLNCTPTAIRSPMRSAARTHREGIGAIPELLAKPGKISRAATPGTCGCTGRRSCAFNHARSARLPPAA